MFRTSLPKETLPHPSIEGIFVCSDGRIFSSRHRWGFYEDKWRELSPHSLKKYPYQRVTLGSGEKYKTTCVYVHRLVMETFSPTDDDTLEIDHIDNDKTNNHLSNLQWITRRGNMQKRWA